MRTIPDRLFEFLEEEEALQLVAYDDKQPKRKITSTTQVVGVPTIGYGHTDGVTKTDIVKRRTCTKAEAAAWLREDAKIAQSRIYKVLDAKSIDSLSDSQYCALLSFVYNLGANASWGIWKIVKAGRLDEVPAQMQRFIYSGGVKMGGLIKRRAAEVALWHEDDPQVVNEDETPSSKEIAASETPPAAVGTPLPKSATFWTGTATAVGGAATAAGQVSEKISPVAEHSEVLGRAMTALAIFVAVCGIIIVLIKMVERKGEKQ